MKEPKDTRCGSKIELTYVLEGDYYIPLVELPKPADIGIWGKRRHDYLLKNRKCIYHAMQMSETLNPHLEAVDREANEMCDRLIKQFATAEGIAEDLKATNQMEWVRRMNIIQSCVVELVMDEAIFQ